MDVAIGLIGMGKERKSDAFEVIPCTGNHLSCLLSDRKSIAKSNSKSIAKRVVLVALIFDDIKIESLQSNVASKGFKWRCKSVGNRSLKSSDNHKNQSRFDS